MLEKTVAYINTFNPETGIAPGLTVVEELWEQGRLVDSRIPVAKSWADADAFLNEAREFDQELAEKVLVSIDYVAAGEWRRKGPSYHVDLVAI